MLKNKSKSKSNSLSAYTNFKQGAVLTAEFVSPMHPDKICDRVADSILDEYLKLDPKSKVAIEVAAGHGEAFVFGEVSSKASLSKTFIKNLLQETAKEKLSVHVNISKQSSEIARGVSKGGAGDQGIMTGYACRENELFVPNEYYLAASLNRFIYKYFPYDGKTQVSVKGNKVLSVVVSFQNSKSSDLYDLLQAWSKEISKKQESLDFSKVKLFLNPAGEWKKGGFAADSGLTGRKIVVDNYGPRVPVGGGAFSGKDPSKVDRSGAYMARKLALQILEKKPEAKEVFLQVSYAIGISEPVSMTLYIDGLTQDAKEYFRSQSLSPKNIIKELELYKPIYKQSSTGHFLDTGLGWNKV